MPGTPRWAVAAAWATVLSVLPSAVWRTAVGLGIPLGWSAGQPQRQQIPGWGTGYVLAFSAGSLFATSLTWEWSSGGASASPAGSPLSAVDASPSPWRSSRPPPALRRCWSSAAE